MLVKRTENKEFEKVKAGIYDAVCYMVCDLGTQVAGFDDESKEIKRRRVRIGFELVDNLMADGRPFVVSKEFTASLHEKSQLTKTLVSWRGRSFTQEELGGFNLKKLINVPCQVQIVEIMNNKTGKEYAVIQNILPKNKHFQFSKLHNEFVHFWLDTFDAEIFSKLYPFLQEKIKTSPEYKELEVGING